MGIVRHLIPSPIRRLQYHFIYSSRGEFFILGSSSTYSFFTIHKRCHWQQQIID